MGKFYSINWISLFLLFILGCGNPINLQDIRGAGALYVTSVSIVNNQMIVYGQGFQEIRGLALSGSSGYYKKFTVSSYTTKKIVGLNEDSNPVPVPSGIGSLPFAVMNLIISTAEGASSIPVTFTLQNDSVFTGAIQSQAVTLEKLSTIGAQEGDVIIYEGGQFVLAPAAGGSSGTGGVDRITFGEGILGNPGSSTATTVTIAVKVGVPETSTGTSVNTVIPYFNDDQELEISKNGKLILTYPTPGKNFAISNNGNFSISLEDEFVPQTFYPLITLNQDGDVNINSPPSGSSPTLTVGGEPVCLQDGSGCPNALVGTVSTVIGVPPIRAITTFTGTTVTISADTGTSSGTLVQLGPPIGGVGSLPPVDGTNLINVVNKVIANSPLVMTSTGPGGTGVVTLNLPTSGTGSVQPFSQALTDISAITPYPTAPNSVIISNAAGNFGAQSGAPFRASVGLAIGSDVQAYDSDLQTIANFIPTQGQYIIANVATNWSLANTPNCGASGFLVAGNGTSLNCSDTNFVFKLRETQYFETSAPFSSYVGFVAPADVLITTIWELPPQDGTIGQVLTTDGNKRLSWGSGNGDVRGPASSINRNVPMFVGTSGKVIADSNFLVDDFVRRTSTPVNASHLPVYNGAAGNQIQDSGIVATDVVTNLLPFSAANRVVLAAGVTKAVTQSGYTVPSAVCPLGQILKSDGTNFTCQADNNTGDVTGPAGATDNAVARFDSATGKLIQNSVVTISDTGDITGVAAFTTTGNLNVGGTGNFTGALTALSYANNSDRILKKDIAPFTGASEIVDRLMPVTFRWKNGDERQVIGLIAQDIEEVIPEVVTTSNQKGKTIRSYDVGQVMVLTLEALKETRHELKQTQKEVKLLREIIKKLEARNP